MRRIGGYSAIPPMRSARSLPLLAAGTVLLLILGAVTLFWRTESTPPAAREASAAVALSAVAGAAEAPPRAERVMPLDSPVPIPAPSAAPSPFIDTLFDMGRAEAAAPASSRVCSVHGRVLDHADIGIASLTVKLYRGREEQQAETDAEGRFAFKDLQRGMYRVCVDRASMPAGMCLLPPWNQQLGGHDERDAIGMYGTAFRLTDDSDPEVDLRVFPAGTVRGRLIDAQEQPIINAVVGIQTADGIHDAARSDATGAFVFDEAYPGAYATSVDLSRSQAGEASAPLPLHFELAPGGTVVLDDLVAGVGGHILRGTVTDLAGQPVAGLGVLCQEETDALYRLRWQVVTDANGGYELGRLPSTMLVLSLGAEDRDRPPESRLLAEIVAPIRVDTRDAPEAVELRVVTVAARHPFHVRGIVQIDDAWAESNGVGWTARTEVRESGQAGARPLVMPPLSWQLHSTERTSRFSWACATPHQEVEFRTVLTGRDGQEHERLATVTPSADGTQEVLLRFP